MRVIHSSSSSSSNLSLPRRSLKDCVLAHGLERLQLIKCRCGRGRKYKCHTRDLMYRVFCAGVHISRCVKNVVERIQTCPRGAYFKTINIKSGKVVKWIAFISRIRFKMRLRLSLYKQTHLKCRFWGYSGYTICYNKYSYIAQLIYCYISYCFISITQISVI